MGYPKSPADRFTKWLLLFFEGCIADYAVGLLIQSLYPTIEPTYLLPAYNLIKIVIILMGLNEFQQEIITSFNALKKMMPKF